MNRIDHLISHPQDVKKTDIPLLKNELEKYPYFYSLRALLLYGLKHENHPSFEDHLHATSIYSNNRVDLYHYLNSKPLTEKESLQKVNAASAIFTPQNQFDVAIEADSSTEEIAKEVSQEKEESFIYETDSINLAMTATMELNDVVLPIEEKIEATVEIVVPKQDNPLEKMLLQSERNEGVPNEITPVEEIPPVIEDEIQSVITETISIDKTEQNSTLKEITSLLESEKKESLLITNPKEDREENIQQPQEEMNNTMENNVSSNETTYSFNDWLKHSHLVEDEQNSETTEKEIKYQLIDDFLERNPKITPLKKNDQGPNTVSANFQKNSEEFSDLMTETLAQIYIEQKKYDKAIKAYKILSLKYPEKNSLFANRIKEIEKFKNTKS